MVYGDGSQSRDFDYAEDLCEGIRRGLEVDRTEIIQLGTGQSTTVNALIDTIRPIVGEARVSVRHEPFRPGEVIHTYCDISKARRILDYDPSTALDEGLRSSWTWFVDNASRSA